MPTLPERLYRGTTQSGFLEELNYMHHHLFTPNFMYACGNASHYSTEYKDSPLVIVLMNPKNFKINKKDDNIYELETPIQLPDTENIYFINRLVYGQLTTEYNSPELRKRLLKRIDPNFEENNVLAKLIGLFTKKANSQ